MSHSWLNCMCHLQDISPYHKLVTDFDRRSLIPPSEECVSRPRCKEWYRSCPLASSQKSQSQGSPASKSKRASLWEVLVPESFAGLQFFLLALREIILNNEAPLFEEEENQ